MLLHLNASDETILLTEIQPERQYLAVFNNSEEEYQKVYIFWGNEIDEILEDEYIPFEEWKGSPYHTQELYDIYQITDAKIAYYRWVEMDEAFLEAFPQLTLYSLENQKRNININGTYKK